MLLSALSQNDDCGVATSVEAGLSTRPPESEQELVEDLKTFSSIEEAGLGNGVAC